ncbi:MAG: enoyl-CoA hydratase/isomerase family protein [Dehalococcoidia bacterium]|uniref:enoyl-CoA hydratase-related protein n=1 Tax=Candidatus Amarobacter glycogenicus TaxID=3140699 RepID=UPI003135E51A|nr:enoyl-CoA hydratase/isomerase family protein [Dehalococcoidia bacterium]MBK7126498.1 enoyl-CoA hydratase/isomerase family protein [Dehalococcoidia bacterium]MBK8560884.1 enoyl-CoA hydratase/isomerase family protein [Dehalococcoidia bacterium]MBK9545615.1 enoyl-CoA hydratase/isomerase family protein [Dehalococcoidia bacterium]
MTAPAELTDIAYSTDGPIAWITFNRPKYRNAQSWRLLDEFDTAMDLADADEAVQVIIVRGAGGNFSSGHDLGTPEQSEARKAKGIGDAGIDFYNNFKHYNLDLLLKWRNARKPTIAMVEGYCIFAGWMMAACVDIVFAAKDALFLPALLEYFSLPYDIGTRKAKELMFESRFLTADEAMECGFVNRVYDLADLERETVNYALRVAENAPMNVRMAKVAANKSQDLMGYTASLESGLSDYMLMMTNQGSGRVQGMRRLGGVDLAVRGLKGERAGLTPRE